MEKILIINAGSSSLKFQLFVTPSLEVIASGLAERIGLSMGRFILKFQGQKISNDIVLNDHSVAVNCLLNSLISKQIIKDLTEIKAIGHRIVQGGDYFSGSAIVNNDVIAKVEELCELAPLHNPASLTCYKAFADKLPNINHVFAFDTSYHQTMPAENYLFPVPYEWYKKYKIRRYGAHGTSHQYVAERVSSLMHKDYNKINLITCHLGNGASISAIKNGKCYNTSMGLSPLGGIMMGTRCGDIDPSVVTYMLDKLNITGKEMDDYLNKRSGLLGVSGLSNDYRDIKKAAKEGDERAIIALKLYAQRIIMQIGSYYMQLGHVDGLVFTAGVGENQGDLREMILKGIEEGMSLSIDYNLNKSLNYEACLSLPTSKTAIWVIPTNEELMIVRDVIKLCKIGG